MEKRHRSTALYREKRRILAVYLALMVLIFAATLALGILAGPGPVFFVASAFAASLLTVLFLVSYNDPATYGWLMFGRHRRFSGSPWQSRLEREMTHLDARQAVEEQMKYEEALYHEKPPGLIDLRETREELKARRRIETPRPDPGKGSLGEGVLKCPQCETPYVFDRDNPICVKCGTRLHRGEPPQDM